MIQWRLSDGMRIWLLAALCIVFALPALAGSGQPSPGQLGFQEAVTPVADDIHWVHDYVNAIIFAITAFVLLLMLYVMWRFSEKRNPTPSRTTHNTMIEVLWTVLPVLILVAIAIPSFRLLYKQYTFPPPGVTIKGEGVEFNSVEPRTKSSIYRTTLNAFKLAIEGSGALQRQQEASEPPESTITFVMPKIYDKMYWVLALASAILLLGFTLLYRAGQSATSAKGSGSKK